MSQYLPMEESPGKMYALAVVFALAAIIATALRFYARYIKKAGYSWDDLALIPAIIFTIATAILMIVGAAMGDLGRHTEVATMEIDGIDWPYPIVTRRTEVFLQVFYATLLTMTLTYGFTKLSVLLFYRRVFQDRWLQLAVWVMIGVNFVWTVGFFFSNLLQCVPISMNWYFIGADPLYCINGIKMGLAQAWSDIATNLIILSLPLIPIWKLQMPPTRKLVVCGIFLLGLVTVGAGIAKLVIWNQVYHLISTDIFAVDITYLQTPFVYWPMIESSIGIIGACLPLMRPLFAGAASRGFMRDLQSVDIPTSEVSETLWDKSQNLREKEEWNSTISTMRYGSGSESLPTPNTVYNEKRMPSLPSSSLNMLRDTPTPKPWMKKGSKSSHEAIC